MPCYRCGVRQTDPARGESPWRRGVLRDHLVLVCPLCVERADWASGLDCCGRCGGTHLMRRLDQVDCLDCGHVRDASGEPAGGGAQPAGGAAGAACSPDAKLAQEVAQALARILPPSRVPDLDGISRPGGRKEVISDTFSSAEHESSH
jgi:hypothetical protein